MPKDLRRRGLWLRALAFLAVGAAPPPQAAALDRDLPVRARGAHEVSYLPGVLEAPWVSGNKADGRMCEEASDPAYERLHRRALAEAAEHWQHPEQLARDTAQEGALLSQIVFCPLGSGLAARGGGSGCRVEAIEPLTATGRHPFAKVGCHVRAARRLGLQRSAELMQTSVFNISNLVLGSRCPREGRETEASVLADSGRALYFDAGCSVWRGARRASEHGAQGSAFGPSMPLFDGLFAKRCVRFERIFGWEARPFNPEKWWAGVPLQYRQKIHFYNVPVAPRTASDPLLAIAHAARAEDYVVFKLDIDHWPAESEFLHELRTNARGTNASLLVDEFFFEYHFQTPLEPELHTYWPGRTRGGSVDDALAAMRELREMGVRAHFWI